MSKIGWYSETTFRSRMTSSSAWTSSSVTSNWSSATAHYGQTPMLRAVCVAPLVVLAAGCGSSGIQGTLAWEGAPAVAGHAAHGVIRNTTSHSQTLDAHSMRL